MSLRSQARSAANDDDYGPADEAAMQEEAAREAIADRITELEQALAERDATIAAAPHGENCRWDRIDALGYRGPIANCTCWKSAAPGDALRAHDAEVQAKALEDAARAIRHPSVPITTPGEAWAFIRGLAKAIREQEGEL